MSTRTLNVILVSLHIFCTVSIFAMSLVMLIVSTYPIALSMALFFFSSALLGVSGINFLRFSSLYFHDDFTDSRVLLSKALDEYHEGIQLVTESGERIIYQNKSAVQKQKECLPEEKPQLVMLKSTANSVKLKAAQNA